VPAPPGQGGAGIGPAQDNVVGIRKHPTGIEPGQFYALGFVTSLGSVALSFAIFLMTKNRPSEAQEQRLKRHDKIVDALTERQTGIDPKTLNKDIEP